MCWCFGVCYGVLWAESKLPRVVEYHACCPWHFAQPETLKVDAFTPHNRPLFVIVKEWFFKFDPLYLTVEKWFFNNFLRFLSFCQLVVWLLCAVLMIFSLCNVNDLLFINFLLWVPVYHQEILRKNSLFIEQGFQWSFSLFSRCSTLSRDTVNISFLTSSVWLLWDSNYECTTSEAHFFTASLSLVEHIGNKNIFVTKSKVISFVVRILK